MSTLTVTVTKGYQFVKDAQDRILITPQRLNDLGSPTATVAITGLVAGEDLTSALKLLIFKPVSTVGSEQPGNFIDVDLQMQDANASNISDYFRVRCWLANAEPGGPDVTTFPDQGVAVQNGTQIVAMADNVVGDYLTDSTGLLKLRFTHTGGTLDTLYFMADVNGKLSQGDTALSWA